LKYIILFILSLAFVFFLIMYGINNENKVLYYSLLIFSMIVSHYWTYEIIPRVCNISKNRLYVCDMIIILLGCFFIIHTIFLDFSLGKSYTEFITLYGSFIIYYKIINLIISIIPKNLTKKYL